MKISKSIAISLVFFLVLSINVVFAKDPIELEIDGPEKYILHGASGGYQELFVNVPADYNNNEIIFSARSSMDDTYQLFVISYKDNSGKYITNEGGCNTSHSMNVPVTPGERIYLKVGVCEKNGYHYTSISVKVKSAEPKPSPQLTSKPKPTATPKPVATSSDESNTATAIIKINNLDDDYTTFTVYIDEKYNTIKSVKSNDTYIRESQVSPGAHNFMIKWKDEDTGEWYEDKISVYIAQGKETNVYLIIDNHEAKTELNPQSNKCYADVKVKNKDDDTLVIDFYINNNKKASKKINPGQTLSYGKFEVSQGKQYFETRWNDPDYDKDYVQKFTADFQKGDTQKLSLYATRHENLAGKTIINIENKDDDELKVDLLVDGIVKDTKKIPGNKTSLFGKYDISSGKRKLSIEWNDPDTREWHSDEKRISIKKDSSIDLSFVIPEHKVSLLVYTLEEEFIIEEGAEEYLRIYFNNNGTIPAQDVEVSTKCSNSLLETEEDFLVVDIPAGKGTYVSTTVNALKPGKCNLDIDVWGVNFDKLSLSVPVEVKEKDKNLTGKGISYKNNPNGKLEVEDINIISNQKNDELYAEALGDEKVKGFSKEDKKSGIEVKYDLYGKNSGKYAYIDSDTVFMKYIIKNTGKYGMWLKVVPHKLNSNCKWKGKAVAKLPDRWRAPLFDEGVYNPYKEFNSLYYKIISHSQQKKSLEGVVYLVPGEELNLIIKCTPKQTGVSKLGADVYFTNSMAKNVELPLINKSGSYSAINAVFFENKYGHRDESFHIYNLKSYDTHFKSVSVGLLEIEWAKWLNLKNMNKITLEKEIEFKKKKTFGQKVSTLFEDIFGW